MAGATPRPRAIADGRNWHVRAYLRAVGAIGLVAAIAHFVIAANAVDTFTRATGFNPLLYPERAAEMAAKYPVLTDAVGIPYIASLDDYLVRVFSYEPILAVLVGGFVCTVVVEMRQRRRETSP
ncbi:hypothetical protein [Halomicrobium urmianum]|uniref:hypothetical protein n=1 Tax=Halomicrobium urmianum TaxID=1586233 RepID=UPI001CD94FCA|nr:hypothetical protein [Halomicrobium urmianum]